MASNFKYACFISYCHGQHELVTGFTDQLKQALDDELDAFLDAPVYLDKDRLLPGAKYNEKLGADICRSLCMVVVYSPRYESHSYCLREFEAMVRLETRRLDNLPSADREVGLIIPVVLRGADQVPATIKSGRHYVDFSHFSLASTEIKRNPDFLAEIRKMALVIHRHHLAFMRSAVDACSGCDDYRLPAEEEIKPWRPDVGTAPAWPPTLPSRG